MEQCSYCPAVFEKVDDLATHVTVQHAGFTAPATVPRAEIPDSGLPAEQQTDEFSGEPPYDPFAPPTPPEGSAPTSGVAEPRKQVPFLNLATLRNRRLNALIAENRGLRTGQFGEVYNVVVSIEGEKEGPYVLSIQRDSQNHHDLFKKYGNNWVGRKIVIGQGYTPSGKARIAVLPL